MLAIAGTAAMALLASDLSPETRKMIATHAALLIDNEDEAEVSEDQDQSRVE